MDNAATFGTQAECYASARPQYPDALIGWISQQAPAVGRVWDVGTGSGQAAIALAETFQQVHATDWDSAQIAQAPPHPRIHYAQAEAHHSGLSPRSVDAITAASALHWFDWKRFWPEVERVARPGALFCAWTYHRIETDDDLYTIFIDPVSRIIAPYWSEGNRISQTGYTAKTLGMPFDVIKTPPFTCSLLWTPAQLAAFVTSWSAHKQARMDGHEQALARIERTALSALDAHPRPVYLPLNVIAARINP